MTEDEYDNFLTPRWKIERKQELVKKRLIQCSWCALHRDENAMSRRPKDDRKKNWRRL
jgi:hypothetical protein